MNKDIKKEKHLQKTKEKKKENFFHTLILAAICAGIFRSFIAEPFHIPSSSMKPNLLIGDYIFVSKFSYGYSKYSFPLSLNIFSGRIFKKSPERGDPAVFRLPSDTRINYIKRIIGLPGDKIQIKNGQVIINGNKVKKEYLGNFEEEGYFPVPEFLEEIDGKQVKVLDQRESKQDNTGIYEVPEGYYFVMGDNRDNSKDSRFQQSVGFIPEENLIGRAKFVFFSVKESIWKIWKLPFTIRYSRLFHKI